MKNNKKKCVKIDKNEAQLRMFKIFLGRNKTGQNGGLRRGLLGDLGTRESRDGSTLVEVPG